MRMGDWTPQVVRFMLDASGHTDYFSRLADEVKREVAPGCFLCDAGCGLGQLSFELAPYARSIDAVDFSIDAVALAGHRALFEGYENVLVRYGDFGVHISPHPYDCMVFSLSATPERAYEIARRNGAKKLIVVNKVHRAMQRDRARESGRTARPPEKTGRPIVYDFEERMDELRSEGLEFRGKTLSLDFGQPFRSLAEAREFFALYRSSSYPNGISDGELLSLLSREQGGEYRYYLPMTRHLALFAMDLGA